MVSDISNADPSNVKKGTLNGASYVFIDNPSSDMNTWKTYYFIKNGKYICLSGYVKDPAVLEHIVATFN